jgi:aspartate kinase
MQVIVQKFGGTSLKHDEGRNRAIHHITKAVQEKYKVVVVVSAMGRNGDPYATDTLLGLVDVEASFISPREYDLLMSCGETISAIVMANMLNKFNIKATAITGADAGFVTNNDHMNAKILDMKCDRVFSLLEDHDVVVVAGFQGQSKAGDITTLGRGGSDTTAAALGAAMDAEWIDIFTDVEGVMTADPRIVTNARPLSKVTYNEICNLAYQGAKVIHPRAVEIAMQAKVPLRIRSTYSDSLGTLVTSLSSKESHGRDVIDRLITGIAHVPNVTQIKVTPRDGEYDFQTKVFKAMANEQISIDFFNISPSRIAYTISGNKTNRANEILTSLGYQPEVNRNCAKVSAVGAAIAGVPGVTAKIVEALAQEGVQILQSADSHTTIWVLVKQDDLVKAVNALHKTFELDKNINIDTNGR